MKRAITTLLTALALAGFIWTTGSSAATSKTVKFILSGPAFGSTPTCTASATVCFPKGLDSGAGDHRGPYPRYDHNDYSLASHH